MSTPTSNPVWAELIQLLPVITLALPFILRGEVDLSSAGTGFIVAAALAVGVHGSVWSRGHLQNPIALGTAAWLGLGAVGFGLSLEVITGWLAATQAFGLFVAAGVTGVIATWGSPHGFVGCRSADPAWLRRASLGLLVLAGLAVVWAWVFRGDIRLGGGLPFIVLNVVRRVLTMRAPR